MTLPTPSQRRRRSITAADRQAFLEALAAGFSATHASERAGRARARFYELRQADPDFARLWRDAEAAGTDRLEDEARRRALEGWDEPVYQQGVLVGSVRKYDSRLLERLLIARRPEKFGPRSIVDLTATHQVPQLTGGVTLDAVAEVLKAIGAVGGMSDEPVDVDFVDAEAEPSGLLKPPVEPEPVRNALPATRVRPERGGRG